MQVYFRSDDYLLTDVDRARRLQLRQQAQADLHQQIEAKHAHKARPHEGLACSRGEQSQADPARIEGGQAHSHGSNLAQEQLVIGHLSWVWADRYKWNRCAHAPCSAGPTSVRDLKVLHKSDHSTKAERALCQRLMHPGVQAAEAARERELEAAEEARLAAEQQRLRLRWRAEQAAEAARTAEAGLNPGKTRPGPQARTSPIVNLLGARPVQQHGVTDLYVSAAQYVCCLDTAAHLHTFKSATLKNRCCHAGACCRCRQGCTGAATRQQQGTCQRPSCCCLRGAPGEPGPAQQGPRRSTAARLRQGWCIRRRRPCSESGSQPRQEGWLLGRRAVLGGRRACCRSRQPRQQPSGSWGRGVRGHAGPCCACSEFRSDRHHDKEAAHGGRNHAARLALGRPSRAGCLR